MLTRHIPYDSASWNIVEALYAYVPLWNVVEALYAYVPLWECHRIHSLAFYVYYILA